MTPHHEKVLKQSQFWLANFAAANKLSMGLTGASLHPTASFLISKMTGRHGDTERERQKEKVGGTVDKEGNASHREMRTEAIT